MTQTCSFCQTAVTALKIADAVFSICPKCHSTFVQAKSFGALRRDIDEGSRRKWCDLLREDAKGFASAAEMRCAEHGELLVPGDLPNVSVPGFVAPCCELLHVPPSTMADLLERGLANPVSSLNKSDRKKTGLVRNISAWLLAKTDKDHGKDDGLDGMQWEMKLKPVLQPKV